MCDPLSMIGFAIGAAQQVVSYQAEKTAAEQQNQLYRENAARANQNARDQMFQTQQRMLQEQEKGADEKADTIREAREAKATATVAAGEAGVSGLSVDALLAEFDGRAATRNDRTDQNTEWTLNQLNNEMKGIRSNAEDRINSVQRAAAPSFFNTGLKIAGVGLDSYNDFKVKQRGGRQ
ncbi:putative internal virion protein [Rhizobium phage RHEph21]|uniref:Internal virion protein n=1 Tax=Rhizobium phage RHEph21 TaxID=2836134 RepID=A0AAE8B4U5_9CAUD|nr:putative internal virion protein [Rhizobium phage RHEph21]